jgi:hypothetical protein
MREIVLDTETTGLDPLNGHRIVEIGQSRSVNHDHDGGAGGMKMSGRQSLCFFSAVLCGLILSRGLRLLAFFPLQKVGNRRVDVRRYPLRFVDLANRDRHQARSEAE